MTFSREVKFHPWVGRNYSEERLLVLGDSHYEYFEDGKIRKAISPGETQGYIKGLTEPETRAGYSNKATWTKFENCFIRANDRSEAEICRFWDSVAFYNFVQVAVAAGPRHAPSAQDFAMAEVPFLEVLEKLKPRVVVVLGRTRLWANLPEGDRDYARTILNIITPFRKYRGSFGTTIAFPISHPSSGFNSEKWRKRIRQSMKIAAVLQEK